MSSPPANVDDFIIKTLRTLYGRRPVSFVICPALGGSGFSSLFSPKLWSNFSQVGDCPIVQPFYLCCLSLVILYCIGFVDGSTFLPTRVSVVATGVRSTLSSVTPWDVIYTALLLVSLGLATSLYQFPDW